MTQQRDRVVQQAEEQARAWASAERQGDVAALGDILAADFVGVGPRGFLLDKDQWLARYRSGDLANTTFALSELSVRVYGPAAVLIARQTQESTYQGRPVPMGELRVTLVLIEQASAWRLAGLHLSPIAGEEAGR